MGPYGQGRQLLLVLVLALTVKVNYCAITVLWDGSMCMNVAVGKIL